MRKESARAIIIEDEKVLLMHRVRHGEEYWVFPGGGIEEGESSIEGLERECFEELGVKVRVNNLFFEKTSLKPEFLGIPELFYNCSIIGGELGTGTGPEWNGRDIEKYGTYALDWVSIGDMKDKTIYPIDLRDKIMESNKKIQNYSDEQIAKKIMDFCLGKYKFIFISGNGGSGKTTLSKSLISEINSRGVDANSIDTDDFMIDTEIRKNAKKEWIDANNNKRISDHGSVFKEAYHLDSLEAVVRSLVNNENTSYKPKKGGELIELKSDAPLTIIEGIGSAFLEKNEMVYSILLICDFSIEVNRRIDRARNGEDNLLREEVKKKCLERREQLETTVLSMKDNFDLELWSQEDYSFSVKRDGLNIF